ncbi:MAG: ATP-binding cassette domain-containing protein, partial [bacterium]
MTTVLSCENLTLLAGGKEIVRGLSFYAYPGDKILLYGPSGSGKSSIVKALLGFWPVAEGMYYFRGRPVGEKNFWRVRREVGYVPQNPDIGEGSLRSLVEYLFSFQANPSRPSDDKVEELFLTFGLTPD